MGQTVLTCEQVDDRDLEAGYIAGRLSEEDAAAFEEHFFGCDRCWALVKTAQEISAAGAVARPGSIPSSAHPLIRQRIWLLPSLAAAALLALIVGGRWLVNRQATPLGETLRGTSDSITVHRSVPTPFGAQVWFGPVVNADRYRVRVFSDAGALLAEHEATDTVIDVPLASAIEIPVTSHVLVEVTALDVLRQPLASSGLIPVKPPTPSR